MTLDHILYLGNAHKDLPRSSSHHLKRLLGVTKNGLPGPLDPRSVSGGPTLARRHQSPSWKNEAGGPLPSPPRRPAWVLCGVPFAGGGGVGHSLCGSPQGIERQKEKDISVSGQHNLPSHFAEEPSLVVFYHVGKKVL